MSVFDYSPLVVDKQNKIVTVGVKAGVGYEYPLDGWKAISLGKRWNVALVYTTALAAGGSYTSSSWSAQDNGLNNYTELRIVLNNAGSTNLTLQVQQSYDNSTWYSLPNQSITLTADGTSTLTADVYMPYIRIVETNNDTTNAQTSNLVYVVMLG